MRLITINDKYRDGLVSVDDMERNSGVRRSGRPGNGGVDAGARQIDSLVRNGIRTINGRIHCGPTQRVPTQRGRTRLAPLSAGDRPGKRSRRSTGSSGTNGSIQLLTPEQQAANRADFIDGLNRLRDEAQARIDKQTRSIGADNASTTMAEIGASPDLRPAADGQHRRQTLKRQVLTPLPSAVTDFADAAANGVRVEINL